MFIRRTLSIRLDEEQHRRLRDTAARLDEPPTALAARLVDEGLRMVAHPLITFRSTPTGGRIAGVVGGPDIAEVVTVIRALDAEGQDAVAEAADWFGLHPSRVIAALDYAADFSAEVEKEITTRAAVAAEARARYDRQQTLLR